MLSIRLLPLIFSRLTIAVATAAGAAAETLPRLFACLVGSLLLVSSAALAADVTPISMKIFGRPRLVGVGTCMMGWSAASIKKWERLEEKQKTLDYWCKENSGGMDPKYRRLFKNEPVSYRVTFDQGKRDIGTLHPIPPFSDQANRAAMKILQRATPFTTPPTDLPPGCELVIRFSSSSLTVKLTRQ